MSVNKSSSGETVPPKAHAAQSRPSDRREAILTAAAYLMRQRGFVQVGIDDIGAAIDLSGPALYRYFDSKQTLLAEIILGHFDRIEAEWLSAVAVDGRSHTATLRGGSKASTSGVGMTRAFVEAAMREPNAMYVMVRYLGLLAGEPFDRVRERRGRLGNQWNTLLPPIREKHAHSEAALRTGAIAGALTHLSLARAGSRSQRSALTRQIIEDLMAATLQPGGWATVQQATSVALTHGNRREAILAVAIPLFCDRGYAAVSLSDIGSPLGITGSAVARQFGSKEDLLASAIMRGSEQISAGVALALRRSRSPGEAARAMLANYVSLAVDFPELVVVQNIEPYALSDRYRSERRKRHRVYVDELSRVVHLAHPEDGQAACRLRAGAAFGAVNQAVVNGARARGMASATNLMQIASVVALGPK